MNHTLTDKDITILEHIVFVADKSAKIVQFCFKKGRQQSYITPKRELLITFDLSTPIKFDYPVADLKTFLASVTNVFDPHNNVCDVNTLVLPSRQDIEDFQTKVVQEIDFTFDDLRTNQRLKKYKHLNIMGVNNKCVFRYQNHERSWWIDDEDKEVFPQGKCSRKFRYVINREKLRLLPNDYRLVLREDVMQFQLKHLNYYFIPEVSWQRHSVKDWTDAYSMVTDEHLIKRYIKMGYLKDKSSIGLNHAKMTDFENVKDIFQPYKKDYFPHVRNDYLTRMIKGGNVVLDKDVVITYNHYKRKQKITEGVIAEKGDVVLHQIVSKNHDGSATDVLQRFINHVNARVFLTVRSSNKTAKKFYQRNGMKVVGHTSWSKGTIPGDVYMLD
jgi:hypothetical protein